MRYLIDTNILLFAIREEDRLSKEVSLTLGKLAPIPDHKDPVDHAIMAHAITNKTTLISCEWALQATPLHNDGCTHYPNDVITT